MTSLNQQLATGPDRRSDLDWLRVAMFAGLIFYHEGLIYEDDHKVVSLFLLATHPWRMSLLFLISGAATRFMSEKFTVGSLSLERSLRLLPPLGFAILALIPIQAYLTLIQKTSYDANYLEFLRAYYTTPSHTVPLDDSAYKLPVYGYLWFVFYLWLYTVVLAAGLKLAPRLFAAAQRGLEEAMKGMGLLIWPFVILAGLRLVMFPTFGVTLGLVDDWYNHVVSGGMFLLGFLIARSERIWDELARLRWIGLAMALAGFAIYGGLALQYGGKPEITEAGHPDMSAFYDLERWGAIVALLGFCRLHLAGKAPAPRYLNGAIFTYYIVHEPAMLLIQYGLKPLNLHVVPEAILTAAGTFAVCALAYEVARRVGWVGVVLGQRRLLSWRPKRREAALGKGVRSPAAADGLKDQATA